MLPIYTINYFNILHLLIVSLEILIHAIPVVLRHASKPLLYLAAIPIEIKTLSPYLLMHLWLPHKERLLKCPRRLGAGRVAHLGAGEGLQFFYIYEGDDFAELVYIACDVVEGGDIKGEIVTFVFHRGTMLSIVHRGL